MNWKLIRIVDSLIGRPLIRALAWRHRAPKSPLPATPRNILLVKFWGIGNIFMLLPTIRALHSTYPAARIDFLTLANNREALTMLGVADRIITIDTSTPGAFISTWRRAATALAASAYDIAIDFEQFARFSALITWQSGASRTIGFATRLQRRHYLYTDAVPYDNHIHITRSFYALATAAGVTAPYTAGTLPAHQTGHLKTSGEALAASHGIPTGQPFVIMHVGTSDNFKERRWHPGNYAALADLLTQRHGMAVILTGLPDEAHLIRAAMAALAYPEMVTDLGGALPFTSYFALIAASALVVSADTAAIHIASALNIPALGLYGPNTPHLYGPWGERGIAVTANFDCSPCITNFNAKINVCRHSAGAGACMKAISVTMAYQALLDNNLLPRIAAGRPA